MANIARDDSGKFPAFAWPGGYPIFYLCADGGCLCPDCANKHGQTEDRADKQWFLESCDVHWEGAPIVCDHCGKDVDSAYGNPELNV